MPPEWSTLASTPAPPIPTGFAYQDPKAYHAMECKLIRWQGAQARRRKHARGWWEAQHRIDKRRRRTRGLRHNAIHQIGHCPPLGCRAHVRMVGAVSETEQGLRGVAADHRSLGLRRHDRVDAAPTSAFRCFIDTLSFRGRAGLPVQTRSSPSTPPSRLRATRRCGPPTAADGHESHLR